jgi:hypothetical protein
MLQMLSSGALVAKQSLVRDVSQYAIGHPGNFLNSSVAAE